jgi:hypothetical protein
VKLPSLLPDFLIQWAKWGTNGVDNLNNSWMFLLDYPQVSAIEDESLTFRLSEGTPYPKNGRINIAADDCD